MYHNTQCDNNQVKCEDVTTARQVALSEETSAGGCFCLWIWIPRKPVWLQNKETPTSSDYLERSFQTFVKSGRIQSEDKKPVKDKRQWRRAIIHSLNRTGSRSVCPAGSTRGGHTHSHLRADHYHSHVCVCVCDLICIFRFLLDL